VNGALLLGSGVAALTANDLGFTAFGNNEQFVIATASGGVTGFYAGNPQGATVTVGLNPMKISYLNNSITLTAIPEPAAALFVVSGILSLVSFRRTSRSPV
jgi:hypothetical protein